MSGEASAIYDTLDTHTDIEDVKRIARNWMDSAAQHLRNEEYYRGVCHEIGETLFGREAHIQDDGGYSESVLVAKLPELAKAANLAIATLAQPDAEPKQDVREALEDLRTHRNAWRTALVQTKANVERGLPDENDEGYWQHELDVFDRTLAALAQSDAEPAADAGLIEAAEWLSTAAGRFEEAADTLRSEYKTYARQMDRWAGDTRERARLFRIFSRPADRDVHGELIPDCPTEGVAARRGNGG